VLLYGFGGYRWTLEDWHSGLLLTGSTNTAITAGLVSVGPEHDALVFTAPVDRLDTLPGGGSKDSDNVLQMDTQKLR
jgi:hypothetical protein